MQLKKLRAFIKQHHKTYHKDPLFVVLQAFSNKKSHCDDNEEVTYASFLNEMCGETSEAFQNNINQILKQNALQRIFLPGHGYQMATFLKQWEQSHLQANLFQNVNKDLLTEITQHLDIVSINNLAATSKFFHQALKDRPSTKRIANNKFDILKVACLKNDVLLLAVKYKKSDCFGLYAFNLKTNTFSDVLGKELPHRKINLIYDRVNGESHPVALTTEVDLLQFKGGVYFSYFNPDEEASVYECFIDSGKIQKNLLRLEMNKFDQQIHVLKLENKEENNFIQIFHESYQAYQKKNSQDRKIHYRKYLHNQSQNQIDCLSSADCISHADPNALAKLISARHDDIVTEFDIASEFKIRLHVNGTVIVKTNGEISKEISVPFLSNGGAVKSFSVNEKATRIYFVLDNGSLFAMSMDEFKKQLKLDQQSKNNSVSLKSNCD